MAFGQRLRRYSLRSQPYPTLTNPSQPYPTLPYPILPYPPFSKHNLLLLNAYGLQPNAFGVTRFARHGLRPTPSALLASLDPAFGRAPAALTAGELWNEILIHELNFT